ncbi:MAG: hypothetical protein KDD82_08130 [Planctomycetes bacterium]|nr:hypothetical protein [Planctomycetota bacterium]
MGRGPYRILISEFNAPRDPMALGNPALERAVAEMRRLFGVNAELAEGILSSVPIVVFADLDQHTAGILAKRLMSLVELGCQISSTTRVVDDLPCMNWPELPPIASLEEEPAPRAAAEPGHVEGLSCPSCGTGLKLVPDDGSLPRRRSPGSAARASAPAPAPAPEPDPEPEDDGDDWMATPRSMGPDRGRSVSPPSTASTRRKSTRFDNPALMRSQPPPPPDPLRAGEPQARGVATAVHEPAEEDHLRVELSDSSIEELTSFEDEPAPAPSPSPQLEVEDLGWDSAPDLTRPPASKPVDEFDDADFGMDLDPIRSPASEDDLDPIRGPASEDDFDPLGGPAVSDSNGFDALGGGLSDFDSNELIQDSSPDLGGPASTSDVFGSREGRTRSKQRGATAERDPFEDSEADLEDSGEGFGPGLEDSGSDLLDKTPPHRAKDTSSSRFRSDLDFLDEPSNPSRAFDDLDELADPPPRRPSRAASSIDPSLSDVLDTFGPEDSEPLDSLDPSPPSLGRRDSGRRAAELSDILEPLDPDEALKIMKSKRVENGHAAPRGSTASNLRMGDDPSSLEPLDPDEAKALLASEPTVDESHDDLFGDPPPRAKARSSSARAGTDPFARTRKRKAEEGSRGRSERSSRREEPSRPRSKQRDEAPRKREEPSRPRSGRSRREEPSRSRSSRDSARASRRSGDDAQRSARRRSSSPPKGGPGKHGLVLSRILDPEKKEVAAELIKQIRGLSLDEARRLTDRTIIPVLKDVTREEAEYHLDSFKDKNIAGRITTRQR